MLDRLLGPGAAGGARGRTTASDDEVVQEGRVDEVDRRGRPVDTPDDAPADASADADRNGDDPLAELEAELAAEADNGGEDTPSDEGSTRRRR